VINTAIKTRPDTVKNFGDIIMLQSLSAEEESLAYIAVILGKTPQFSAGKTFLVSKNTRGSLEQVHDDVLGDILSYVHPNADIIVSNAHYFLSLRQAIKYQSAINIKNNLINIFKAKQYTLKMRHQVSELLTQDWIFDLDLPQTQLALFIQRILTFSEDAQLSLTGLCQIVDSLIKKISASPKLKNNPTLLIEALAAYPYLTQEKKKTCIEKISFFCKTTGNVRSPMQPKDMELSSFHGERKLALPRSQH
jgi:hypothetical protein